MLFENSCLLDAGTSFAHSSLSRNLIPWRTSMKRMIGAACGVLAMMAVPVLASAQTVHAVNSKKADLHLSEPMVVGTQTLEPGDYVFQCQTIDGKEYLVVKSNEGDEVARVPCTPETLDKKVAISEFRMASRDGKQYLTSVRIQGETIAHRVVTTSAG
jgi:hypothetical protein